MELQTEVVESQLETVEPQSETVESQSEQLKEQSEKTELLPVKMTFKKAAEIIIQTNKKDKPPPLTIGQLMKETLRKQRELIKEAMDIFPYFETWSDEAYKDAATISAVKEYKPDEIIFGYNKEKSNFVYFLMEGTACVLQRLRVETKTIYGKYKYKLHDSISTESDKSEDDIGKKTQSAKNIKDVFMQLCVMTKGECFGIGNELKGSVVVAKTPVECLLIPRYVLYNNDYANMWSRIEQFLASRLPTTEELFEQFKYGRRWVRYREKLYNTMKPNNFHVTTLHDVPYHWRVNCVDTLYHPRTRIA